MRISDWSSDVCSSDLRDLLRPDCNRVVVNVNVPAGTDIAWTLGCQAPILPIGTKISETAMVAMGRPRSFDIDEALDRALEVFWRKGYEGASLSDLTEAMGIARPSLYAAFGNKEELFCKALDRYVEQKVAHVRKAFEEPTARGVAERLLRGGADMLTDPCHPRGCLAVQGALSCGDAADRSEEHTSELQSLMRISYAVFCLQKKT